MKLSDEPIDNNPYPAPCSGIVTGCGIEFLAALLFAVLAIFVTGWR